MKEPLPLLPRNAYLSPAQVEERFPRLTKGALGGKRDRCQPPPWCEVDDRPLIFYMHGDILDYVDDGGRTETLPLVPLDEMVDRKRVMQLTPWTWDALDARHGRGKRPFWSKIGSRYYTRWGDVVEEIERGRKLFGTKALAPMDCGLKIIVENAHEWRQDPIASRVMRLVMSLQPRRSKGTQPARNIVSKGGPGRGRSLKG